MGQREEVQEGPGEPAVGLAPGGFSELGLSQAGGGTGPWGKLSEDSGDADLLREAESCGEPRGKTVGLGRLRSQVLSAEDSLLGGVSRVSVVV